MYVVAASAANRLVVAEYRSLLMRLAAISWRRRTNRVGGIVRIWSSSSTLNSSVESYRVIEGCPLPVETLYVVSNLTEFYKSTAHVCATMLHTAHVRRRS
jgi:hypothetical protein